MKWVVETSQSGGKVLHGPFETRRDAADFAAEVLLHRSANGSRTVAVHQVWEAAETPDTGVIAARYPE